MARIKPFPPMDCGVCGKKFTPSYGQYYDRKEGRVHCCGKECERVRRQEAASKSRLTPKLECGTCGSFFIGSKSQRYKASSRKGYKPYCSTACYAVANSENTKRRIREGTLVWRGTPAQLAQGKRLGEYSLANKKFGRDHPNWKNGLTTMEMLEARRLRVRIQNFIKEGAKLPEVQDG